MWRLIAGPICALIALASFADKSSSRIWIGGFLLGGYWTIRGLVDLGQRSSKNQTSAGPSAAEFAYVQQQMTAAQSQAQAQHQAIEDLKVRARKFAAAACRVCALAVACDGDVADEEMKFLSTSLWTYFSQILPRQDLEEIITFDTRTKAWQPALDEVATQYASLATEDERFALLSLAMQVLTSDGKLNAHEKRFLWRLAARLDVPEYVVRSMYEALRESKRQSTDTPHTSALKALGLEEGATRQEIEVQFRKLAMKYHPDRVGHLGEKVQAEATARFKVIVQAHRTLIEAA